MQAEDITLFDRDRRKTIALYPSAQRRAQLGTASYDEDAARDYDVLDTNIDVYVSPDRQFIDGRARLRVQVRANQLSSLTLRLADALNVSSIISPEYGRLLNLRVRGQNTVLVNLPATLTRDTDFSMLVSYSGRIESQEIDAE